MVGPDGRVLVWGVELRYLLTWYLVESGTVMSVGDLGRSMRADGFAVEGEANKVVSDALRWELRKGRVVRVGRGRYRCGVMPRQTKSRIRQRVAALRQAAFAQRRDMLMAAAHRARAAQDGKAAVPKAPAPAPGVSDAVGTSHL